MHRRGGFGWVVRHPSARRRRVDLPSVRLNLHFLIPVHSLLQLSCEFFVTLWGLGRCTWLLRRGGLVAGATFRFPLLARWGDFLEGHWCGWGCAWLASASAVQRSALFPQGSACSTPDVAVFPALSDGQPANVGDDASGSFASRTTHGGTTSVGFRRRSLDWMGHARCRWRVRFGRCHRGTYWAARGRLDNGGMRDLGFKRLHRRGQ